jgi:hypothetical protein
MLELQGRKRRFVTEPVMFGIRAKRTADTKTKETNSALKESTLESIPDNAIKAIASPKA